MSWLMSCGGRENLHDSQIVLWSRSRDFHADRVGSVNARCPRLVAFDRRLRHSGLGELDRFRDRVRAELPGLPCCRAELTAIAVPWASEWGRRHWRDPDASPI